MNTGKAHCPSCGRALNSTHNWNCPFRVVCNHDHGGQSDHAVCEGNLRNAQYQINAALTQVVTNQEW